MVKILILEEHIQTRKQTIVKNSKEEIKFIADVIKLVKILNTSHISGKEDFESIIQEFAHSIDDI